MNRKLRLFMLFLMLTLFAHGTVYAADEKDLGVDTPVAVETSVSPDTTEGKDEQDPIPAEAAETEPAPTIEEKDGTPAEGDLATGEKDLAIEPKTAAQNAPKSTEDAAGETEADAKDKAAEETPADVTEAGSETKTPTENGATENVKPTSDPKPEAKKEEKSEELKALEEKIAAETDENKKKALQKEYNEKYFDEVAKKEEDKLNEDALKRINNDKEKINQFYALQDEYNALLEKKKKGQLTQNEIDAFKQKLNEFNPPRKLTTDEQNVLEEYKKAPYIPGVKDPDDKGKELFGAYEQAKKALEEAINPEEKAKSKEELDKLLEDFKKAEKALKDAIDKGEVTPKFTDGNPKIKVYPLDYSGRPGNELKDETYYIPDNTDLELLVQVNKDEKPKELTFTLKPLKDEKILPSELEKFAVLFGKANDLKSIKNDDGSYTFTTDKHFGVAQLTLKVNGFRDAFHKGFSLEMVANGEKVTKNFLITKKGYEDEADISGEGSDKKEHAPGINAGETEGSRVKENSAKKVYDFFSILKKSNAYIDDVLVNSGNGESLPLSSVDITLTLPKDGDKVAEYIHKSGLRYHDNGDGTYTLKLDLKEFGGNLSKNKEGKLLYNGKEIEKAELADVILEEAGKKVYIDKNGKAHDIVNKDVLEKDGFKVEGGKLYKDGTEIGTFDKDNKIVTKDKIYRLEGDKLISYTSEAPVFEGYVANKDGKAEPNVTPTLPGRQVEITDGENKSYGGTIIEDGVYKKTSEGLVYVKPDGYKGFKSATVDESGKKVDVDLSDGRTVSEKDGIKIVEKDGNLYRIIPNPVFKDGYLMSDLEYRKGLSLVDKRGRLYKDIEVIKDGEKYSFKKEGEPTRSSEEKEINISEKRAYVDNKNYIVKDTIGYETVGDKYYYNGKNFVEAKGDGLKGKNFLVDYKELKLDKTSTQGYIVDNKFQAIEGKKTTHKGSINPEDFYKVGDSVYVKKGDVYLKGDGDTDAEDYLLTEKSITKIVQTLGDKEQIVEGNSIYDLVLGSKFGLKFPNFLAGEGILYNLHGEFQAWYRKPAKGNTFEDVSIFEKGVKIVDKYFWLKTSKKSEADFFKNPPKELEKTPDYRFFNFFYREENDRKRDDILKDLFQAKETFDSVNKKLAELAKKEKLSDKEAAELKALEKQEKELKEKAELLSVFQKELGRLYNGAQFVPVEEGDKITGFVIKRGDEKVTLDRSLLWKIGFNNEGGALFPENSDDQIVVDDYHLDNRLVYDEIIVNQKKSTWEELKKEFEKDEKNQGKTFGDPSYFFLDQIGTIRFGVNPNYIDGSFVSVGKNFKLTGEEIQKAINEIEKGKTETTITKDNGISYRIKVDNATGQIRIKVLNAFYKKPKGENFSSPVQKAYENKIQKAIEAAGNLNTESKEKMEESFAEVADAFHAIETKCNGTVKEQFKELMGKIKNDDPDKTKKLEAIKTSLQKSLEDMKLSYLDSKKGDYKLNDFRFNAIRVELKTPLSIGGALDLQKTKQFGITSVLIPEVDVPYTDEFGEILTNKDKYVAEEIYDILKNGIKSGDKIKTFDKETWNTEESTYREVMKEAFKRVNAKIDSDKIKIKNLATFDKETGYAPLKGSDKSLSYGDLAITKGKDTTSLKNRAEKPINGFYIGEGKDAQSIEKKLENNKKLLESQAYKDLVDQSIDLAAYYMHKDGYNRDRYGNKAHYRLMNQAQGKGLFNNDDQWKKTICYDGIGRCIEIAGNDSGADKKDNAGLIASDGNAKSDFGLDYSPMTSGREKEEPKVDKSSNKDKLNLKNEEKEVDFTVDVTVDKLKKDQKDLAHALGSEEKGAEEGSYYNKNGYYVYKNALIMDLLPDVFTLTSDTTLKLTIDRDKLMANGANNKFRNEEQFKKFEKGVEYFYTEDVKAYLADLRKTNPERAKVLEKALEGKLKEGKKQGAILAWLPEFEAPHGSKDQFTFKLNQLTVNVKKFKQYPDKDNLGQLYINHAAFGNKAEFYWAEKPVRITDGHEGLVNKYLQLLDKDGNVLNKDQAEGWFRGNAEVKFGDKFNYKISIKRDSGIIDTGGHATTVDHDWSLDDLFPDAKDGLRPVLRDYVIVPKGFKALYKLNGEWVEKSKVKKEDLSKVTGIRMKSDTRGFKDKSTEEFILPMMIPELDAKIEDGKVVYIGTDGKKHELGEAKDFFNLDNLVDKDKDLSASNKVEGSNTVTVYLEKERFIKLYKEFFEADGTTEIKTDRPEVKFNIYQIVEDENGNKTRTKLDKQLVLNEKNKFVGKVDGLPLFKKVTKIDENGKVTVEVRSYTYEVEEVAMDGYAGKVFKFDENDKLGFVFKAKNTKKPETPPETPPEEPKTPPEEPKNPPEEPKTPPEEPNTPPETPDKPGTPDKPHTPDKPNKPERPNKPNRPDRPGLPKTGVADESMLLLASGGLLLALLAYRRKYAVK